MRPDTVEVTSDTTLGQALLALDMTLDELLDVVQAKSRQRSLERGVIDVVPWTEAIDAFVVNLNRDCGDDSHVPLAKGSMPTYKQVMREFREYVKEKSKGKVEIEQVCERMVPFIEHSHVLKGLSDSTVNKYVAILRRFGFFLRNHYTTGKFILPSFSQIVDSDPQSLNAREIRELYGACKSFRSNFLVAFLLCTGLRRNEFRLLRVRDVHLTPGDEYVHVRHGKGGRERKVPLCPFLIEVIKQYVQVYNLDNPSYYLFGRTNRPWSSISNHTLDEQFNRIVSKVSTYVKGDAVKGFHLHTLRHTYARFLLQQGVQLRYIQDLLGHRRVSTTEKYTRLNTESLRTATADALEYIGNLIMGIR